MNDILIATRSHEFVVTNTSNVTTNGFTEPVSTVTIPSGTGVIALGHGGGLTVSAVMLAFFGVGSDTNTFLANVYGWQVQKTQTAGNQSLWIPILLCTFTGITLDSSQPGVANTDIPATSYFATAITLGVGNSGVSVEVVSPGHAAHEIAHAIVDTKGSRFMEVRYSTGGSATSCNGLYKRM